MFTIKLKDSFRTRILEAESFTIFHQSGTETDKIIRVWAEVTLHHPAGDKRFDVGDSPSRDIADSEFNTYRECYIENATGKTVESLRF